MQVSDGFPRAATNAAQRASHCHIKMANLGFVDFIFKKRFVKARVLAEK